MSPVAELRLTPSSPWTRQAVQSGAFIVDGKPATMDWFKEHLVIGEMEMGEDNKLQVARWTVDGACV